MTTTKFRFFLFLKLPIAFIAGLKLFELSDKRSVIAVKYGWLNQNPFRSMFWAVEGMAAELSTGLPALLAIEKLKQQQNISVAMLLIAQKSEFHKKAVGKIKFSCEQVSDVKNAIESASVSNDATTIWITSKGIDEQGDVVAEFDFHWSFRKRS